MVAPAAIAMGVSTGLGAIGGIMGAGKAKAAAYEQAALLDMQLKEEIRRKERQHKYAGAEMTAMMYTDGIMPTGSRSDHVDAQHAEMARELQWMNKARQQAVRAAKKGAAVNFQADMFSTVTNAIGGFGNAFGMWNRTTAAKPSPIGGTG